MDVFLPLVHNSPVIGGEHDRLVAVDFKDPPEQDVYKRQALDRAFDYARSIPLAGPGSDLPGGGGGGRNGRGHVRSPLC